MKRLTFDGLFCDIAQCKETPGGTFCENGSCSQRKIWERLKAYEDTKLEPEEVKDMAENAETRLLTWCESRYGFPVGTVMDLLEAKQEGRIMVLPCKVGDTVYMENGDDETPHFVDTGKVFAIGIDESGTMWISVRYESGLKFYHPSDDIGKTVFLTREEAERALEGGQNDGR